MFDRIQTSTVIEAVAQRLIEMIQSGALKPGDRLPTEEELSVAFGVGRSSVREAKRILIAKNLLISGSGKGTFVCEASVDQAISSSVIHRLLTEETKTALQEARNMLEVRSVELAVQRADEDDLAEIADILAWMRKKAQEGKLAYQAGLDFHLALVAATHNPVFVKLYEVLVELLKVHQEADYSASADPLIEYEEHAALYQAILDRDLQTAVRLMKEHMDYVRDLEDRHADHSKQE